MTHQHVCIWIDHYEARIFGIGLEEADISMIRDSESHHHIHRKADHLKLGTEPLNAEFLKKIAAQLHGAKAILICGPGKARHELASYLNDQHPAVGERIWGVEPMDHPTDPQLIAFAAKHFRAADRMHG